MASAGVYHVGKSTKLVRCLAEDLPKLVRTLASAGVYHVGKVSAGGLSCGKPEGDEYISSIMALLWGYKTKIL